MLLVVNKDWATYKKGDKVEIEDQSVIDKGIELGLFSEPKTKEVKTKE